MNEKTNRQNNSNLQSQVCQMQSYSTKHNVYTTKKCQLGKKILFFIHNNLFLHKFNFAFVKINQSQAQNIEAVSIFFPFLMSGLWAHSTRHNRHTSLQAEPSKTIEHELSHCYPLFNYTISPKSIIKTYVIIFHQNNYIMIRNRST